MALIQNTGVTPTGATVPIPVAGLVASTQIPLAANGVYSTDILPYKGNDSIHFSIVSDQIGSYAVEYYRGGTKINFQGNTVTFDPTIVSSFQGALAGKGDSFKIIYTNGATAQGTFYLEVRFSDISQQTQRSLGVPASATNMAGTTHAVIEGRTNGTGNYNQVTTTPVGAKIGQDVNILNPVAATDVSALTNGSQRTIIVDGNNTIRGTVTNPFGVQVTNQPTSYESIGIGGIADAMQLDATKSGSVIALLKGLLQESIPAGTTGTFTAITLVANTAQTIAANANRKQVIISSTNGTILIGVGFTATASNWSYRIVTNGMVEIEQFAAPLAISLFSTSASNVNVTQVI